jgi:hypothetical protein
MGQAPAAGDVLVIEPAYVQDIFVTGIEEIEELGDCARFSLYVDAEPLGYEGPTEHHIRVKIVISIENLPKAIRMAMCFLLRMLRKRCRCCPPYRVK